MVPISFDSIFRSSLSGRDKFLSRLFGIFSEDIVRTWCKDDRAPYQDMGRPTIRNRTEKRGRTLDFTFQSRNDGRIFVGELKCELEFENYRYLSLTSPSQLSHHKGETFTKFLDVAKNPNKYTVTVNGKNTSVSGAILVWGRVTERGREAVIGMNKSEAILSLEEIIANLLEWNNNLYWKLVTDRATWCQYLFRQLVGNPEQ
jgi:hypothetical protein